MRLYVVTYAYHCLLRNELKSHLSHDVVPQALHKFQSGISSMEKRI